jgi:glycosyltransferase involved in cell wall biosynthesis
MKKKILFLSHTDIKYDSRIIKEMLVGYQSNFDVFGIGIASRKNLATSETTKNLDILSLKLNSRFLKKIPYFLRMIFSLIEFYVKSIRHSFRFKPDIIHCGDTITLPLGVIIKFLVNSKLLYDAHELESDKNGSNAFEKKFIFFVEKFFWSFIDSLVVVSPAIENWYHTNVGFKQTEVILNSPMISNNSINSINTDYLRQHFNIPSQRKIFIYVGGVIKGRGIEKLIEVFKNNEFNAALVILGYGDLFEKFSVIASQNNYIYLHQSVPHDKVVEIIRSADFGTCLIENVSLSDYLCLPNKLFEYSFAQIPILGSNFPEISRIINLLKIGVCCDPENLNSIAHAAREIMKLDITMPTVQDLYEFSWENQQNKLGALYIKLINSY